MTTGLAWLIVGLTGVVLAGPAQLLVTRTSVRLVMATGMTITGAGILWATQAPAHASFWASLAGVTERDAGVAAGLIDSSQQLGGAIGIAVASTVVVAHSRVLHGLPTAGALTSGFHWALWVCGLTGLAAVPVALLLVRAGRAYRLGRGSPDPGRNTG